MIHMLCIIVYGCAIIVFAVLGQFLGHFLCICVLVSSYYHMNIFMNISKFGSMNAIYTFTALCFTTRTTNSLQSSLSHPCLYVWSAYKLDKYTHLTIIKTKLHTECIASFCPESWIQNICIRERPNFSWVT